MRFSSESSEIVAGSDSVSRSRYPACAVINVCSAGQRDDFAEWAERAVKGVGQHDREFCRQQIDVELQIAM